MKTQNNTDRFSSLRLCHFAGETFPRSRKAAEKNAAIRNFFPVFVVFSMLLLGGVSMFAQDAKVPRQAVSDAPIDTSKYRLARVYTNDFSTSQKIVFERDLIVQDSTGVVKRTRKPDPKADWIVEGYGGVDIRDGKLRASPLRFDADGKQIPSKDRSHLVIWNKRIFPSDMLAEFDMDPGTSAKGLTILFFSAAGKNGEDLFDMSLPPRQADYKTYHSGSIANYSDSYWSRNTDVEAETNRMRKNPGFTLVAEGSSLTKSAAGVPHHVRILKIGGHIEIEIDAKVVLKWDDPGKPLGAGRIGFRSMEGVDLVTYDNFKVWKVSTK